MLLLKIFQPIEQLCSDSTKGSTFCCIQRLLMMSLHVYVTLLNKKYSLVCLVRKNRKLVGVILDQKHSVADVIQKTLFTNFQCTGLTAVICKFSKSIMYLPKIFTSFDQSHPDSTLSTNQFKIGTCNLLPLVFHTKVCALTFVHQCLVKAIVLKLSIQFGSIFIFASLNCI